MTNRKTFLLAATAVAVGGLAAPGFAQTGTTSANTNSTATVTPANGQTSGLDDIIVTARKVEERLQDVPLSIRALTGKDLTDRNIQSLAELSQYTPGLTYSPDFGRTGERPVIRGISALRTEAPQPVSVFVDGVFVRDAALSLNLDDAQRVEVIKGPQSALYGRSTYAGAINYITVKPGNDLEGRASISFANHTEDTIFGAVTVPIVKDVLSVRVRGKHYVYGGEYRNSQTGRFIGKEKTNAIGGEVRLTPSENFEALGTIDYAKDHDGLFAATVRTIPIQAGGVVTSQNNTTNVPNGGTCNGRTINIVGNNAAGVPDPAVPASLTTRLNGWPCGASNFTGTTVARNENDLASYTDPTTGVAYGDIAGLRRAVTRGTLTLNFHFHEGYTLTSQSAYTHQTANLGADQSYNATRFAPGFGAPAASWLSYDRDRLNYGSQELRLTSPQDQPFTWLIGGYYYREKTTGVTTGVIKQNAALATIADPLRPKSDLKSRNIAGFARAQYAFGEKFKISAEGRYGEEKVSVGSTTSLGTAVVTAGTCTVGQPCIIQGSKAFRNFAPRVTADYKIADDVLLYVQAARGTKSGGFNSTAGLPASTFTYDGESVWSYEAGIKSEFLDHRLRFNAAIFDNEIKGLQLSNIAAYTNPITGTNTTTTIVNNVGKARTRGFEIEAVAKATGWLTLSGNYAYVDAKAREGTETTNGTVYGGNRSVAGFELPRNPKHSAAVAATINVPVSEATSLFARGDLTYQSRRYAEIQNLIWADPFTHVNLAVGVQYNTLRVTGFMKNATDNDTSLNGFRYLDPATFRRTAVDFLPRLRQYGVSAAVDF